LTQIVVNHLTRMRAPRICVAGIEVGTEDHVRPVTDRDDLLTRSLLTDSGGPLQIGAVIDLGETTPRPSPPETEDRLIESTALEQLELLSHERYLETVERIACHSLRAAFGMALERHGRTYAVDLGGGRCSLGCVRARNRPDLEVDSYGKLRLCFRDTPKPCHLPINDLRFYEEDHQTIRREVFADVQRRLLDGTGVWVMFGLSRPWASDEDEPERHWLQVNGLCLEDGPIG
jgi:hypothetical protein